MIAIVLPLTLSLSIVHVEHLAGLGHLNLGAFCRRLAGVGCFENVFEIFKRLASRLNEETSTVSEQSRSDSYITSRLTSR
jgi:hypothetical protein